MEVESQISGNPYWAEWVSTSRNVIIFIFGVFCPSSLWCKEQNRGFYSQVIANQLNTFYADLDGVISGLVLNKWVNLDKNHYSNWNFELFWPPSFFRCHSKTFSSNSILPEEIDGMWTWLKKLSRLFLREVSLIFGIYLYQPTFWHSRTFSGYTEMLQKKTLFFSWCSKELGSENNGHEKSGKMVMFKFRFVFNKQFYSFSSYHQCKFFPLLFKKIEKNRFISVGLRNGEFQGIKSDLIKKSYNIERTRFLLAT